eukprot:GHUV01022516.1.p1 GENE.GHUV01022516.1~~GHUV01022516.1.p1  ORF type:complete len:138 (+),score=56.28 GHUV01022516.1:854-1267(+)
MKLDWHKNTLGKGMVQTGAEADSKRGWGSLVKALQQHISSRGTSDSSSKVSEAAAGAAMGRPSAMTSCSGLVVTQSSGWDSSRVMLAGGSGLALLLLLLLVIGVWGVVSELKQMNSVLRMMSNAAGNGTSVQSCTQL